MSQFYRRELDNGQTVYFSLVDKQSQRGFTVNKRLFLMLENQFICYLSSPKIEFPLTIDYISKNAKLTVPLKQITKLTYGPQKNAFRVQFWVMQDGKRKQKHWVLQLSTSDLLLKWQDSFDEYSNRSRRGTLQNQNQNDNGNNINLSPNQNNGNQAQNKIVAQYNSTNQSALEQELVQSQFLLKEDRYLDNLELIAPSPVKDYNQPYLPAKTHNFQLSKLRSRKDYFSKYGGQSSKMYNFTNYYRPYIDDIISIQNSFLRTSQLEQADRKYTQFIEYAQQHVINLIDYHLQKTIQNQKKRIVQQSNRQNPGIIRYTQVEDIVIEFGFVELKKIAKDAFICDDILNKTVLKSFKNLEYLFEAISKEHVLKNSFSIPMACIIHYKGYQCVVYSKVDPTLEEEYQHYSENNSLAAPTLFSYLSQVTRISLQVFQEQRHIKLIPRNIKRDKFVIISANYFLPQFEEGIVMKKQAFSAIFNISTRQMYSKIGNKAQIQFQNAKIDQYLTVKQKQLSIFFDKLEIYPISPEETHHIFRSFGVNFKHLAKVCTTISQSYVLGVLKTQAALRVFKIIYMKKIQDNLSQPNCPPTQYTTKQFLNLFLGNDQGSIQLWKVISLHTQKYFNLHVQITEINKGYLFLGLNYHLSIQIYPSTSKIDNIFKINSFVDGVKFYPRVFSADILPAFMRQLKDEIQVSMNYETFKWIVQIFWLQQKPFPKYVQDHTNLHSKLMYLCSFYVKPDDQKYLHLKLYEMLPPNEHIKAQEFNAYYLKRKLTQIRWFIKQETPKQHILFLTNTIKETIHNYYGKYHPFISEIYELQSLYHLEIQQREEAININKQSLANMIKCCGNNIKHIKISNNYYQMAQCFLKCRRIEESLANYKKAMNILQMNKYQELPEYAHILYKIGIVTLNLNKDSQSYELFTQALRIYQSNNIYTNWTQIVNLYQLLSRCQTKFTASKISFIPKEIKIAQHIIELLQKTLNMELQYEVCSDMQFVKMLKLVFQTYLNRIRKEEVQFFRDYLIDFCDYLTIEEQPYIQKDFRSAILYFKNLISIGNFLPTLQNYVANMGEILARLKNQKLMGQVKFYRRNDYLQAYQQFIRHLIYLFGETFLLNTVK